MSDVIIDRNIRKALNNAELDSVVAMAIHECSDLQIDNAIAMLSPDDFEKLLYAMTDVAIRKMNAAGLLPAAKEA